MKSIIWLQNPVLGYFLIVFFKNFLSTFLRKSKGFNLISYQYMSKLKLFLVVQFLARITALAVFSIDLNNISDLKQKNFILSLSMTIRVKTNWNQPHL